MEMPRARGGVSASAVPKRLFRLPRPSPVPGAVDQGGWMLWVPWRCPVSWTPLSPCWTSTRGTACPSAASPPRTSMPGDCAFARAAHVRRRGPAALRAPRWGATRAYLPGTSICTRTCVRRANCWEPVVIPGSMGTASCVLVGLVPPGHPPRRAGLAAGSPGFCPLGVEKGWHARTRGELGTSGPSGAIRGSVESNRFMRWQREPERAERLRRQRPR